MNSNLKMTVERSKRRSYFLSLVFITKCFSKNLLLHIFGSLKKVKISISLPSLAKCNSFHMCTCAYVSVCVTC